ncbi:hypothetical protein [Bordetella phage vB_BbrM_PHB04]|uniref:Uncharacterized protein n=1 Tax=Bordetella phage vB_BbrM_PHB04 TaxID=2029657 RepID=A0A291L9Z7_9CAUD|nr:hypothetical protein HOS14_gp092 [Bordetella phage vB_BbrM_PHB04]ATI15710.1 hypothetical protein [Bordetella phage vB_BbrM_PHB04]
MGLDVYLKKCADRAEADRIEDDYEKQSDAFWEAGGGYSNATEEQKVEIRAKCAALAEQLGIDGYQHKSRTKIEVDSKIDPEHYFKIGYFRSSYNGGGFDAVMRRFGLPSLGDIMGAGDDYEFVPDWDASLARANDAIAKYEAHLASPVGKYDVLEVSGFDQVGGKEQALAIFAKEIEREHAPGFRSYSNRAGDFYLDGIKAVAVIPGGRSILGQPETYIVYEKESGDGKEDWYLTAIKIVRETCEYVIAQPDRQHFYLVWSG